ncbi:penthalaris-like [Amblyomma americanum]
MRLLVVIIGAQSLVALPLAVLPGDNGDGENCTCATPALAEYDDYDISFLYFYDNESKICRPDFVKRESKNTFPTFYDCVTTCNTGQSAVRCAGSFNYSCECPDRCSDAYYYNMTSQQCVKSTALYEITFSYEENAFLTRSACEFECMGFTAEDVNGKNTTSSITEVAAEEEECLR